VPTQHRTQVLRVREIPEFDGVLARGTRDSIRCGGMEEDLPDLARGGVNTHDRVKSCGLNAPAFKYLGDNLDIIMLGLDLIPHRSENRHPSVMINSAGVRPS
jgi:hypothetical protein